MQKHVTIVCPGCAFTKAVPAEAIPAGVARITCPKCAMSFSLPKSGDKTETKDVSLPPDQSSHPDVATAVDSGASPFKQPEAPPSPPYEPPPTQREFQPTWRSFSFNGSASEYFGIWIVNTLLKIVTIGFYSAWAKVRQRCFFYGNTDLAGDRFEYTANPWALFRGWVIAAVFFVLYMFGEKISPVFAACIAILFWLVFPWLIVRSRMFNWHNSSYRNIRFSFRPPSSYWEPFRLFSLWPILVSFTLGLLWPSMKYRQQKFLVENTSYGSLPFRFNAQVKDFYIFAGKLLFVSIVVSFLYYYGLKMCGLLPPPPKYMATKNALLGFILMIYLPFLVIFYFIMMMYIRVDLSNLCWNATSLGTAPFRSTLRKRDMAFITLTNAVAILFTAGLLSPWARVRLTRYRLSCLELQVSQELEEIAAGEGGPVVSAVGEEIGDVFNLSIDIGM